MKLQKNETKKCREMRALTFQFREVYESVIKLKNVRAGFQSLRWRRPRWRLSARTAPVSRLLSGFYVSYRTPRPRYYVRRGVSSIELRMYHVADARAPRPEYRGSWDTHVSRLVGFRSFKRRACALKGY